MSPSPFAIGGSQGAGALPRSASSAAGYPYGPAAAASGAFPPTGQGLGGAAAAAAPPLAGPPFQSTAELRPASPLPPPSGQSFQSAAGPGLQSWAGSPAVTGRSFHTMLPPAAAPRRPASERSLPPSPRGAPPQSGPGAPPGSGPGMGHHLVLVLSRLLDMPIEKNAFGSTKRYRVRVYNDENREVGVSKEISGLSADEAHGRHMETISIPVDHGVIRVHAASQLIYVEVEHASGFLGGSEIGRCQIHRLDPRSSQIWPYALSDKDGLPANCGIELKVVEKGGPPLPVPSVPMSYQTVGPMATSQMLGPPAMMPPPLGPPSPRASGRHLQAAMQDVSHGVCAQLQFDKVTDMPYPRSDTLKEVLLTVFPEESDKELRRVGPFAAMDQGASTQHGRLVRAACMGASVFVQAPLHFGGAAEEGAMYLRVAVAYANSANPSAGLEFVGGTDSFKVCWVPSPLQYHELRGRDGKTLGGVYLKHRLLTEAEAAAQQAGEASGVLEVQQSPRPHAGGAPVEPLHRVRGRLGHFPPGSQEEAYEQAAINAEAQNRALLQRCKMADPQSHETNPHVQFVNGYREWDSLDSLFGTMGPNPLTLSEEVGPTVARSYQDASSVLEELRQKLPKPMNPADERLNLELIRTMYRGDPRVVQSGLRPVICKNPEDIARSKDLSWCPDPPVYAPMRNMREEDKETLRLACYAPEMNAKLLFCDANPNYRLYDDIWGVLADYKSEQCPAMPPPPGRRRRVKDDCIMA